MFKLCFSLLIILLLSSCNTVEQKQSDVTPAQEINELQAWHLSINDQRVVSSNRAVAQLLQQADALMAEANFEKSSDKLERLVRIEPHFAQAWSRLAWIALEKGQVQRSHQLAQRSNSYSRGNDQLRLLNWQFILKAGELLGNIDLIQQAKQMIQTLSVE